MCWPPSEALTSLPPQPSHLFCRKLLFPHRLQWGIWAQMVLALSQDHTARHFVELTFESIKPDMILLHQG